MLSWDDFRIVKAIADRGSLTEAAKTLRINQSTVFRNLGQIEQRIDARLFKRNRSALTLRRAARKWCGSPNGWRRTSLRSSKACTARLPAQSRSSPALVPVDEIMARTGLEFLTDMANGKLPQPPMCATLGFHLAEVSDGYARFDGVPEFRHYNPIGTVHGGFAATLLDSALGCAIFTRSPRAKPGPRWN